MFSENETENEKKSVHLSIDKFSLRKQCFIQKNYFALLILSISPSLGLSILCGIGGVLLLCHVVVLCFLHPRP